MNATSASPDAESGPALAGAAAGPVSLTLGDLVQLVAAVLPEAEVPTAVRALFEHRLVSFARLLSQEEREALQRNR